MGDFLPFALDNPTEDEQVLVKHLLTHTSSILEHNALWEDETLGLYSAGDSEIDLNDFLRATLSRVESTTTPRPTTA